MNPTLSLNPITDLRAAAHVPVHGQRARGGHDRRRARGDRRLVHGAAPPELRRPHAVGDGVPGRGRRRARRPPDRARLLRRVRWRRAARCAAPAPRPGRRGGYGAETATIGTVQTVGLAAGFLFLSLNHAVLGGTETLLFGTFLGVSRGQVLALLLVAIAALALIALATRPLLLETIDPEVARAARRPGRAARPGLPARARAGRRRHQPDHRRAARVRAARGARRPRPSS